MKKAFSLIELCIVVAIVALCALVIGADLADSKDSHQHRQRARRAADGRRGPGGVRRRNSGNYPYDGVNAAAPYFFTYNYWYLPRDLTTPVAYLQTHLIPDPYRVPTTSFPFNQYNNIRM